MFISNEEKNLTRTLLNKHDELIQQLILDVQRLHTLLEKKAPHGFRKDGTPCAKPGRKIGSKNKKVDV